MITSDAASLVLSIVGGLVKLAGRIDTIMAEKAAVESQTALPMPPVTFGRPALTVRRELRALLKSTQEHFPDPLGSDREKIQKAVDRDSTSAATLDKWYAKYLPKRVVRIVIRPDHAYFRSLASSGRLNLDDPDARIAAVYLSPGVDDEKKGYAWRIALGVVDTLAEFGAENAALVTRDEGMRRVLSSVLQRFSKPDLSTFDSWGGLLKHALSATINGALDAREALDVESPWLDAVLNILSEARGDSDDYVLGLLSGRGYRRLVASLLGETAARLRSEDASVFQKIAADVMAAAGPLVEESRSFRLFFESHWADLLRSGLQSLEVHGPKLLEDESPLLRDTLVGVAHALAETEGTKFLSSDTLFRVVDAAVAAVASQPDLVDGPEWVQELVSSVVGVVAESGVRSAVSVGGLEMIVGSALGVLSQHPELIARKPDLMREIVGGILGEMAESEMRTASGLASAAIEGALGAVAENPDLLDTRYAEHISGLAGRLQSLVAERGLTSLQAKEVLSVATESVIQSAIEILDIEQNVFERVLDGILEGAKGDQARLLGGKVLVDTVRGVLTSLIRYAGTQLLGSLDDTIGKLQALVEAGLSRASKEIGQRLALGDLPAALSALVAQWARGELGILDPEDADFKRVFSDIAERVAA